MNHPCNFCINLWYRRLCTILKETLNAGNYEYEIYKKEKFLKLPSIGGFIWKCALSTAKQSLDMELSSEKKVPFRPKRSLFRSCWGMQFFYELTSPNKCYSRWKTDATSSNGPQLNFASAIILSILGKRNDALMPLVKVFLKRNTFRVRKMQFAAISILLTLTLKMVT